MLFSIYYLKFDGLDNFYVEYHIYIKRVEYINPCESQPKK